jgi:hypothetical protein
MPTTRVRKGTDFILRVFDQIPEGDIRLIEGVTFSEAVRLRKEATIFFDQFMVGFYGNSAIEAMQYGIPVSAWLSPASVSQANGQLGNCPVLTTELQVDKWADMIRRTLDSDMTALSQRSKQWCDMIHGYLSIAKKWEQYYKQICAQ